MSCHLGSLRCLLGAGNVMSVTRYCCARLYVPLVSRAVQCPAWHIRSLRCTNTASSSQIPFDPDLHLSPSPSINDQASVLPNQSLPLQIDLPDDWQGVPVVYTTGVSYKNEAGIPTGRIGIFWGEGDVLNRFKVLDGCSTILAEIEAVNLALKQAIDEENLSRVVVITDSDYVCRCITKYITFWKQSDYRKQNGDAVKYTDQLQELDRLLSMVEARVQFMPKNKPETGNWVMSKLKPQRQLDKKDIQWSDGSTTQLSTDAFSADIVAGDLSVNPDSSKVVYTCGVFRETDLRGEAFTHAGLGAFWPDHPDANTSRRLSMFPVTLFRSQLQAIVTALEQAIEMEYGEVTVRTDSKVFLKYILRQWTKADGSRVKNHPQYLKIIELASRLKVKFEYANETCKERDEALVLAEDGLSQPMVNQAKRFLKRGNSDPSGSTISSWKVVVDSDDGDWTGVDRVCLLSGPEPETGRAKFCVYWTGDDDHLSTVGSVEGVQRAGAHALRNALVMALEQASERNVNRVIVRLGAVRLLKTLIEWLPQWKRNGWTNSLKKPIANNDQWKYIDQLLNDIQVKWEYSNASEGSEELRELDTRAKEYFNKTLLKETS